jgi:hypothetical protein
MNDTRKNFTTRVEFELLTALNWHGLHVQKEFRIPGTHRVVDFYISYPARALVELKIGIEARQIDTGHITSQLASISKQFGSQLLLIVVTDAKVSDKQRIQDAGIATISLKRDAHDLYDVAKCAQEISDLLFSLPYKFEQHVKPTPVPITPKSSEKDNALDAIRGILELDELPSRAAVPAPSRCREALSPCRRSTASQFLMT